MYDFSGKQVGKIKYLNSFRSFDMIILLEINTRNKSSGNSKKYREKCYLQHSLWENLKNPYIFNRAGVAK